MEDFAKKYAAWYEGLDKIVKILFCLLWDIPANLYRLAKSVKNKNVLGIVLAILLMIFGGWILCVIDIVSLALKDKIYWIDDLKDEEECHCSCFENKNDNSNIDDQTK